MTGTPKKTKKTQNPNMNKTLCSACGPIMINLTLWPKFWVLRVRADMVDVLSGSMHGPQRCSDHVRRGELLKLFRTLLQRAEGFLAWAVLNADFTVLCAGADAAAQLLASVGDLDYIRCEL